MAHRSDGGAIGGADETLKFDLSIDTIAIRWTNYRDFVESESASPLMRGGRRIVVFVTFNNPKLAKSLLERLVDDPEDFDLLVVDNHSKPSLFLELDEFVRRLPRPATLVRAVANTGSGGGYALALEYALNGPWSQILVTEDDAMPVSSDVAGQMFRAADNGGDEVVVRYLNAGVPSFSYHFHLYSRRLLERAGVPDPRLMQVADDFEWLLRTEAAATALGSEVRSLQAAGYIHPILKDNLSPWAEYLNLRNRVVIAATYRTRYVPLLLTTARAVIVALAKWTSGGGIGSALALWFALRDSVEWPLINHFSLGQRRTAQLTAMKPFERRYLALAEVTRSALGPALGEPYLIGGDLRRLLQVPHWKGSELAAALAGTRPLTVTSLSSGWRSCLFFVKRVAVIREVAADNQTHRVREYRQDTRFGVPSAVGTLALTILVLPAAWLLVIGGLLVQLTSNSLRPARAAR